MDVHVRHGVLHRAQHREIGLACIVGMDAALHADFGCAAGARFKHPASDLLGVEIVGRPAQTRRHLAFGEGAEGAAIGTDIGVVDVAVDDIAHSLTEALARRSSAASQTAWNSSSRAAKSRTISPGANTAPFIARPKIRSRSKCWRMRGRAIEVSTGGAGSPEAQVESRAKKSLSATARMFRRRLGSAQRSRLRA